MMIISGLGFSVLVADTCLIPSHWFRPVEMEQAAAEYNTLKDADVDPSVTNSDRATEPQVGQWEGFRALWRQTDMAALLVHHLVCQIGLAAVLVVCPLWLSREFGLSMVQLSSTWLVFDIARFLATHIGGVMADRCSVRSMNILLLGLQMVLLGLIPRLAGCLHAFSFVGYGFEDVRFGPPGVGDFFPLLAFFRERGR